MRYWSNDDVVLRLFAEARSPFLLTINVILGKLLALLYALAPGVPWYDVVMTASLAVAAGVLVWAWGKRDWAWGMAFALLLLLPAFLRMQFTVTAMLCACAGIALVRREQPWLGAVLIVWGSLIRFEAAMLVVVLALPFVWSAAARPPLSDAAAAPGRTAALLRRLKAAALPPHSIVLACVVAFALFGVNRVVYRLTPGYEDFYEFNALTVRVSEYMPESRVTPAVLARLQREVGWSENDLRLFSDWFHALYPIDQARRAAALLDTSPSPGNALESVRTFVVFMRWPLALMCVWFFLRPRTLAILGALLVLVAILGALSKPPPPWISLPLVACAVTLLPELPRSRYRWFALAFAAVIAVRAARAVAPPAAMDLPPNRLVVLHGGAYPYEHNWRPFRPPHQKFDLVPVASSAHTPPVRKFGNIPLMLCTDDYALLVAYPHIPPRLERYLLDHRGLRVHFDAVAPNVWRCRPAPLPLLPPVRPPSLATAAGAANAG